jgi:phage-related holin
MCVAHIRSKFVFQFYRNQYYFFYHKFDTPCIILLRLVVIEPSTTFVEGVISLKDIFTFLLG